MAMTNPHRVCVGWWVGVEAPISVVGNQFEHTIARRYLHYGRIVCLVSLAIWNLFFEEEGYSPFPKCNPLRRPRQFKGCGLGLGLSLYIS